MTGCLRPTPADNLPILAGIQPAELRPSGATLSLARCAMEPGHLLHSTLTRPSSADVRRLKSRHPLLPAAQQLTSSPDNKTYVRRTRPITNGMWSGWTKVHDSAFSSPTPAPTPAETSQEGPGSGLIASALVSGVSAPVCTNRVRPPLRPVNVAQKNKPSIMLSFNVQPIDLLMNCTAWRLWMIRQSNGCSTPAPSTSVAKQWLEQLAQKKK